MTDAEVGITATETVPSGLSDLDVGLSPDSRSGGFTDSEVGLAPPTGTPATDKALAETPASPATETRLPDYGALKGGKVQFQQGAQLSDKPLIPPEVFHAALFANPALALPMAVNRTVFPQVEQGLERGTSEALSGFTTPTNIGMLAVAPFFPEGFFGKVAATALGAAFEAQAVKQAPDLYQQFQDTTNPEEKTRLGMQLVTSIGLPLTTLFHTGGKPNAEQNIRPSETNGRVPEPEITTENAPLPATQSSEGISPIRQEQVVEQPSPETNAVESPLASTATPLPTELQSEGAVSGANVKAFEQTYGEGEIPTGATLSPEEEFIAAGERAAAGKSNPYGFVDRAKTGAITPHEMADLIYEHDRLVNEASAAEGTPQYDELYQRAKTFAQNVVKPAETAWHQKGMMMQIEAPIDYSKLTGFRVALEKRMNREMTPQEVPAFQKIANDVSKARQDAQDSARTTTDRVLKRFSKVKDVSFDEAVKEIHDSITEAIKDCNL